MGAGIYFCVATCCVVIAGHFTYYQLVTLLLSQNVTLG